MQQKKRRKYVIIGSILLILIIARLLLPYIVLKYANKSLAEMKRHYGHLTDIDISLYRGAYQLDEICINTIASASNKHIVFFQARKIDLAVEWKPLLYGSIVGDISFFTLKLVFTKDKEEFGEVAKDTTDFRKILKGLMPLKVTRFGIDNGSIHYVDSITAPKVDGSLEIVILLAQNLKSTTDSRELRPSTLTASAKVYGGTFRLTIKLNALAKEPTFDMTADMKEANLARLNDFLKAYSEIRCEQRQDGYIGNLPQRKVNSQAM